MKCFLYFLMQNSYIFNLELIDIMLNSCHGIECWDMNIAFLANALNSLLYYLWECKKDGGYQLDIRKKQIESVRKTGNCWNSFLKH